MHVQMESDSFKSKSETKHLWKIFLGLFLGFLVIAIVLAVLYSLSFGGTAPTPVKCDGVLCADHVTCCANSCVCINGNCKCPECGDGVSCTFNGKSGCCQPPKICSETGPQCCDSDGTNCVNY